MPPVPLSLPSLFTNHKDLPSSSSHPLPISPVAALIKTVLSYLRRLYFDIPVADFAPVPPPWMQPMPTVFFTPIYKAHHPVVQKKLTLEAIATFSATINIPYHIYADGTARCAVFRIRVSLSRSALSPSLLSTGSN
ncbi:hypothetical protein E2C01_057144 [Portunus trituberculatus]|uniref:Uncharacterized protein n=1 Tax=Portunus trituberculatus TaxID=210409 RepID=A0A5B7GW13_PORTR|nr:hypothetical protein [Portunus trituberculatus]